MVVARMLLTSVLVCLLPAIAEAPAGATPATETEPALQHVLAVSVDGLNPSALGLLGPEGTPHLHRLLAEGAATLNARTQVESTETLPNHISMVTGRPVRAARGGHGVTWNTHRAGTTVQRAAGRPVSSVFTVAHAAGTTAVFAGKKKFSILERSWDADIDRAVVREGRDAALVRAARADLLGADRSFALVHLAGPDVAAHADGFLSPAYLDAVRRTDALVGSLLRVIDTTPELSSSTAVILTSDHGGARGRERHDARTAYPNYRIPFVVWGAGVAPGDLYAMNPAYGDPGRRRVGYAGRQPIRNGDLANLALDLLGLGPVPGSRYDARQTLSVG